MKVRIGETRPLFTVTVGLVTAEVYLDEGIYNVFVAGDTVKAFFGSFRTIEDCQRGLDWLMQFADSEFFKQAVSEF